jgi:hypothetical protein
VNVLHERPLLLPKPFNRPTCFAFYFISLFDAHTNELIDQVRTPFFSYSKEIPKECWKKGVNDYSLLEDKIIREYCQDTLIGGVEVSLKKMNLIKKGNKRTDN